MQLFNLKDHNTHAAMMSYVFERQSITGVNTLKEGRERERGGRKEGEEHRGIQRIKNSSKNKGEGRRKEERRSQYKVYGFTSPRLIPLSVCVSVVAKVVAV